MRVDGSAIALALRLSVQHMGVLNNECGTNGKLDQSRPARERGPNADGAGPATTSNAFQESTPSPSYQASVSATTGTDTDATFHEHFCGNMLELKTQTRILHLLLVYPGELTLCKTTPSRRSGGCSPPRVRSV